MVSIRQKSSSIAGKAPLPVDIERGELAVNLADKAAYTKDQNDAVVRVEGTVHGKVDVSDTPATTDVILSLGKLTATGAVDGTYMGLALQGGTGTGATIDIIDMNAGWEYEITPAFIDEWATQGAIADGGSQDWGDGKTGSMSPLSPGWAVTFKRIGSTVVAIPPLSYGSAPVEGATIAAGYVRSILRGIIGFTIASPGNGYTVGDVLTLPDGSLGAGSTGISIPVTAVGPGYAKAPATTPVLVRDPAVADGQPGAFKVMDTTAALNDKIAAGLAALRAEMIALAAAGPPGGPGSPGTMTFGLALNTEAVAAGATDVTVNLGAPLAPKISWGDGGPLKDMPSANSFSHSYPAPGVYVASVTVLVTDAVKLASSSQLVKFFKCSDNFKLGTSQSDAFQSDTNIEQFIIPEGNTITNMNSMFAGCGKLKVFRVEDKGLSAVTTMSRAFKGAGPLNFLGLSLRGLQGANDEMFMDSAIGAFGTIAEPVFMPPLLPAAPVNLDKWFSQSKIRSVTIDTGIGIGSLVSAFEGAPNLAEFNVLDLNLSNCTSITKAFQAAGKSGPGFVIPGGMNWQGLAGNQYITFWDSKVLSIGTLAQPVKMPTAQDYDLVNFASYGDFGAPYLAGVYFDTLQRCTSFNCAFTGCSALREFFVADGNMSKVTDITKAFQAAGINGTGFTIQGGMNWQGLTGNQFNTFFGSKVLSIGTPIQPVKMPTAQDYDLASFTCYGNDGAAYLTHVYFDTLERCTSFNNAFKGCLALKEFRVGSVNVGFRDCTNLSEAFFGCALTEQSVDHILLLCLNGGKNNLFVNLSGGTSATPSAAGLASKAALVAKGWTITHN